MNIAYSWLKEYIDTDLTPQEIGDILTQTGLEVGSIEEVETVKGGLKGLVIGEVLTCIPHPNSDHLSITTVDVDGEHVLPIVCGAPNVAAKQKVVVATVGTVLFDGDKEFKIKKSKIRGEASEGMICAEDEIGLGQSHDGIMVLDASAKVGTPAAKFFNVESDFVIEVDLTPNRIDGASHIGTARDLAAFLKQTQDIEYTKPSVEAFKVDNNALQIPVEIGTPEACPRYAGVTISGVEIKDSPEWLQNRLRTIGLTPINNIVDVTNFVLFETAQPLHAFDAAEIKGNKIIVQTLAAGTKFTTLDEVERELHTDDLMICNGDSEPMCIGGVFGGINSGVKASTQNIFLESAWFDPVYIRKTARRHGLNTDASFRFERGTDPDGVLYALKRAALLIQETAGGTISSNIVDVYPEPAKAFDVDVKLVNVKRLIGIEIPVAKIKKILAALEIEVVAETAEMLSLKVPPYRVDVQRESDVIEDILRIYGYNNIEPDMHVNSTIQYSPKPNPEKVKNQISDLLASNGFNEIWSNSLTKASNFEELDCINAGNTVTIFNPLSQDLNAMRQSLLFGGLETISRNTKFQNSDLKLFEFGNTYFYKGGEDVKSPADKYYEESHLALFVTGNKNAENWTSTSSESSFFVLKSYVENILDRLGFNKDKLKVESLSNDLIEEGLSYQRGDGKVFVELGYVNSKLLKKSELENNVFYADFFWNNILTQVKNQKPSYTELPKFPAVRRDLALLVDESITFSQLKAIAQKCERKLLRSVDIFDVYKGDKLPAGKKSYAMSFILRDDEKTLNDKVIEKTMQRFISMFEREVGATLR
ncbi:MAG: phenylalanine--tRNA ligase subunit beta [Prolixibacteraceae bacterium]|jgi:phenylalanyl-tRNA synthetase beta chain|nr:phenylalanine--tRNA ligase subunit beta [Prolixibacteraceae bacterium]